MSTIIVTTGVPGSGKTYLRCARFLIDHYLLESSGTHYSNFPVDREAIADYLYGKVRKKNFITRLFYRFYRHYGRDDFLNRIQIIPPDVIMSWRRGESGPWDYFDGKDLTYCHIAIDEIHEIISATSSPEYVQKWDEFLGTIRHRGCTFEGITQDFARVNRCFSGRASIRYELTPAEDMRDPFFSILYMDWYELKACFTGDFHKTLVSFEYKKAGSGRWKKNHTEFFHILPFYFRFYNSFSAPSERVDSFIPVGLPFGFDPSPSSDVKPSDVVSEVEKQPVVSSPPQYEYQKRSRIGLLCWFLGRNWFNLFSRVIAVLLFIWLCFFGGIPFLVKHFIARLQSRQSALTSQVVTSRSSQAKKTSSSATLTESSPAVSDSLESSSAVSDSTESGSVPESGAASEVESDPLKSFDPYQIIMFSSDCVTFRCGIRISRGEFFPDGSRYGGLYVQEFNFPGRYVVLSDSTVLRMRQYNED